METYDECNATGTTVKISFFHLFLYKMWNIAFCFSVLLAVVVAVVVESLNKSG